MDVSDPVESIPLVSLKAVQLRPGDVVVMTTPDELKPHEREYWGGVLSEAFPDNESLLLDNGADLAVLRRSEPELRPRTRPLGRRVAS